MSKSALRKRFRLERTAFVGGLSAQQRAHLTDALIRQLTPWAGAAIASYAAVGDEIDPGRRFSGTAALLPRIRADGQLDFALPTTLVRHPFGIDEPAALLPALDPDVILVPLLAVDADGYRLGQGGGYYDRTLAAMRARRRVFAIGCAWPVQCIERLPREPWDERLDAVVTPDGCLRLSGGGSAP